jgi:hypothetical protein
MRVVSVMEIDLDHVRNAGIRGMIFDLDDTLVHSMEEVAGEDVLDWLAEIREEFQVYIVSNNKSHLRVELAARHLDIPFLARAMKPSRRFFRVALREMALDPHEVAIVGDQLFTDVLGGNRLGAFTILVDPISLAERKWHRKIMRSVETIWLKRHAYHQRGEVAIHPTSLGPSTTHHPAGTEEPAHRHPSIGH